MSSLARSFASVFFLTVFIAVNAGGQTVAVLDLSARNGEANTEAVALRHCFEMLGIGCLVTDDVDRALTHRMVCTAGSLWNATLSAKEFGRLTSWMETGGTLVSSGERGNKYNYLFGAAAPVASRKRFSVEFADRSADASLSYIDRPEEKEIFLGNRKLYDETIWTRAFAVTGATTLATGGDGLSVLSVNAYGKGLAYLLGVSVDETVLLPQTGGDYEAQRSWANAFEPGADVFVLLLKGIFERTFEPYVYLSAIPDGARTAFLLSHDVDAQTSFRNSVDFAELEKRYGVRSTFFITTKYFTDESDIGYYDALRTGFIRKVKELGGDIGSHSVSHSQRFSLFPPGAASIRKETYAPLSAPSVLGELLVSKQLLDGDLASQNTVSFRSGELRIPEGLGTALERAGYRCDSSYSANDTMTNFAWRMMRGKSIDSGESSIVEIPVTFDDSQGMLTAANLEETFRKWLDVIWANADNEAISVMLIHPTVTEYKLKMEEKLLAELRGKDVWIGDITSYASFWNERASLAFRTEVLPDALEIRITDGTLLPGLCFVVGRSPSVRRIRIVDSLGSAIDCEETARDGKIFVRKR